MAYQPKSYKKFVATAATATLVASAVAPTAFADHFTDVSLPYADAVNYLVDNNIAQGVTATEYGTGLSIKRGDAAVMIANALGLDMTNAPDAGFTDLNSRIDDAVNALVAAGVVSGKTPFTFAPNDNITRQEMAKIIANAYDLQAGDTVNEFVDVNSNWDGFVDALLANGITFGKTATTFASTADVTRGEFALFIYRAETRDETPVETGEYVLSVSTAKASLTADGADNTAVTVRVLDAGTRQVALDADDIVVAFDTTYGSLANTRVTVQDGEATVLLTSEFSAKNLDAIVRATLIETAEGSKFADEIGIVGSQVVKFVPASGVVDVQNPPIMTGAESNMADRVTVYFDKPVTPAMFYPSASNNFNPLSVSVTQVGETTKQVIGYKAVPGNANAVQAVLNTDTVLTDNKSVSVTQLVGGAPTTRTFNLTDARQPEATSVTQIAYNKIEVQFSEPVDTITASQIRIDGGLVAIDSVVNGVFTVENDKRDTITVTTSNFLTPGKHSIQLSGIRDFAGRTDNANVSTNQIFDFTVVGTDTVPAASVVVESPEQVRVKFNTFVNGFNASEAVFQWYNPVTKAWETKTDIFNSVTPVAVGSEYVYEMTQDWTNYFNTASTGDNYYNHQFRVVLAKDEVTNPANGKNNVAQEVSLNYTGSPLNTPDTASPTIPTGAATEVITNNLATGTYKVDFSEVVKDRNLDTAGNTPSQLQGANIPNVVVEFIGTDSTGKKVTLDGQVVGYADSSETSLVVRPTGLTLQQQVDQNRYSSNWQLVVRNVTDDVGNAAPTLNAAINVVPTSTPASVFKVKDLPGSQSFYDGAFFYTNGANADSILLAFTSAVSFTGTTENALNLSNYTLNGVALPAGTVANLSDGDGNVNNGYEVVTIVLPDGTLNATNVLNISKSLKSASGLTISGQTEISEEVINFTPVAN